MKHRSENHVSRKGAKGAKVTGRGPSSRVNTRDPRKISPFGRNDKSLSLRSWRPFDFAQDMLGALTCFVILVGAQSVKDKFSHLGE